MAILSKKGALVFAMAMLFASSRAFASIPRSMVLDAPSIDRFAVDDCQVSGNDDNALLVARSLAAALPNPPSIASTIDTSPAIVDTDVVQEQLHVFGSHVVIRKLATRAKFFASQSNFSEFSELGQKLRRGMKYQALPFQEPATGLVFARARWYDPQTGAFLSPDPFYYKDSSNLYAFAGGDPVNGRDPTGTQALPNVAPPTGPQPVPPPGEVIPFPTGAAPPTAGFGPLAPAVGVGGVLGIATNWLINKTAVFLDEDADNYVEYARQQRNEIKIAAAKRRNGGLVLPRLPGVSPHTQQTQLLPADSTQSQVATIYHNQSVRAQKRGRPAFLADLQRGNDFNRLTAFNYPYRELRVHKATGEGYWVVDAYDPTGGEIVSRKNTQFGEVKPETGINYLREFTTKYAPGARIANVPSTPPELIGLTLRGRQILEVPKQTKPIPKAVLDEAKRLNIEIRDVHGHVY